MKGSASWCGPYLHNKLENIPQISFCPDKETGCDLVSEVILQNSTEKGFSNGNCTEEEEEEEEEESRLKHT